MVTPTSGPGIDAVSNCSKMVTAGKCRQLGAVTKPWKAQMPSSRW